MCSEVTLATVAGLFLTFAAMLSAVSLLLMRDANLSSVMFKSNHCPE